MNDPLDIHPDLAPGAPGMRAWKASDIPDAEFLRAIDRLSMTDGWPHWVPTDAIFAEYPQFPYKVVLAKARQLIKRKLLGGCGCGCRGDFELTDAGRELINV